MIRPFERVLIANRGEIACRVIRTLDRLGIESIAVFSAVDASARHVRLARRAIALTGDGRDAGYLDGPQIIRAALAAGAQAVHPGYGFLSENADFATAVCDAGLAFVGPSPQTMQRMASKAGAKQIARAAGVPVVPGYDGEDQDDATLKAQADTVGYPLMLKAAHGGGGKGMRIVRDAEAFAAALASCRREATNAFGRDRMIIERYIERPRHIEVQILGDAHGDVMHLFERECSAQRRHQKVLEEAPSATLPAAQRQAMFDAALALARAVEYKNAGTVEFIVSPDHAFHFLELNARLQVEHPVTEATTGVDLVEWQLRVAAGESIAPLARNLDRHGHAIEVRIYAEDPARGFLPGSGRIEALELPEAQPGIRIDSGVDAGDIVTIFYDPMIAKLTAWGEDRSEALARLRRALSGSVIAGPASNIGFLEQLVRSAPVVEATIDTGLLDRPEAIAALVDADAPTGTDIARAALAAAVTVIKEFAASASRETARNSPDPWSPLAVGDGWQLFHGASIRRRVRRGDDVLEVDVRRRDDGFVLNVDGDEIDVGAAQYGNGDVRVRIDGTDYRFGVLLAGPSFWLHDGNRRHRFEPLPAFEPSDTKDAAGDRVVAPMPGKIVALTVKVGDAVEADAAVGVIEAMKMELALKSPRAGRIAGVHAAVGDFVEADSLIVDLEPSKAD